MRRGKGQRQGGAPLQSPNRRASARRTAAGRVGRGASESVARAGGDAAEGAIAVRPLRPTDWPLVEELFGPRGACGGCWCMWWRVARGGREWEARKGEPNRAALRALVEAGEVHAVLALAGGRPVAWCSFGPKESFPRLAASRALSTVGVPGIWSLACFYVPAGWRGRGVATALLAGAVAAARQAGAGVLEAYPVEPRGARVPAAFAWTGVPALFAGAGFTPLPGREGSRPIYRLALR